MLPVEFIALGTTVQVALPKTYAEGLVDAEVVKTPFKKPDSPGTGLNPPARFLPTLLPRIGHSRINTLATCI